MTVEDQNCMVAYVAAKVKRHAVVKTALEKAGLWVA